jgi:hypothetical protein
LGAPLLFGGGILGPGPGLSGFLAFWLSGFLAFWLSGFLAFWLFGFGFLTLSSDTSGRFGDFCA